MSPVAAECRAKLVKDAKCCLDESLDSGVAKHFVKRDVEEWLCDDNCYDNQGGRRGVDVMWVPKGAVCDSPRLLYVHGGAWMYGGPEENGYASLATKLANSTGAVVLSLDYPLAPERKMLGMVYQTLRGLEWLSRHGPPGCPAGLIVIVVIVVVVVVVIVVVIVVVVVIVIVIVIVIVMVIVVIFRGPRPGASAAPHRRRLLGG